MMHDPMSVAHEIRYPWRAYPNSTHKWERDYRAPFITIWHVDPEKDGTDDSCGWFIRQRHLSQSDKDLARRLITCEHDNIAYWFTGENQDEKVSHLAGCFAALRRRERPWWRHPKWHVWHWRLQIHPWETFRRWLLTRCALCGKRFDWGYSPVRHSWHSEPRKFLRGEKGLYHSECSDVFCQRQRNTVQ